ncbi:GNAT family N-acetyltransferase [Facklamia sp. 7083-14-GEN3]|uniref:GNAT family N-acetyltransferase n=1 Tax=Facklamia sp. 7083-14-GEN3 TaxID=2973478 RepID=UPI00215C291A|nr:GNAT family N-acetyltransferase [Facklamia sp. 7083-14-GEN3]MCR8968763.1 GNAT family N-acetyltransferase [Facklamia sp. 7083-14-GEN3]
MEIRELSKENVKDFIIYLKQALAIEPDMMTTDHIDEEAITKAVYNKPNELSRSLLAYEDGQIVGRLEFHSYLCIQDSYRMAYVNWVYTLPAYRHRGVAQSLFKAFETICLQEEINQYFLIQAENQSASRFYKAFEQASSHKEMILRKTLK